MTISMTGIQIDFFVFFIDNLSADPQAAATLQELEDFAKAHKCLLLTRKTEYWNDICPDMEKKQWYIGLPNAEFQKMIIKEHHTRIEKIAYVSDDPDFLANALGSFSHTILIRSRNKAISNGRYPDIVCSSIHEFISLSDNLEGSLIGERIMSMNNESSISGIVGCDRLKLKPDSYADVLFAGRYFGLGHFRSSIDLYSLAIRKNKDRGSKLHKAFDDVFLRILKAEANMIRTVMKADTICCVPDRSSSESKGKLYDMTDQIARSLSLCSIQRNIECVKDYPSQKSTESYNDRTENVRNAFRCNDSLHGKRIIILDDIMTTGSTLSECAKALYAAGAAKVDCAVLAVNQLSIDYWQIDSAFPDKFSRKYRLSMNAAKRIPFFSQRNSSGTISYEAGMKLLYDGINHDLSSSRPAAIKASDDDEF